LTGLIVRGMSTFRWADQEAVRWSRTVDPGTGQLNRTLTVDAMLTINAVLVTERMIITYGTSSAVSVIVVSGDQREDEPLLTSGDVAKRLGVAVATISAWVRQGRLTPAVTTMGGRYRFRWSEVQDQLRAAREAGGE
jgi:excisionase family DNA binding protein